MTDAALLAELLDMETQVWRALVTGDADTDARLLHADFLGVYPSGFSDRAGHVSQLDAGPSVQSFSLHEARVLDLGPDLALLAYRAEYQRVGQPAPEEMYVSSLWRRIGDTWTNIFSQDTPKDP